jgi:hypothetical protein
MNCLFRRKNSEQGQKAISIMTGGKSASRKHPVIRQIFLAIYASQFMKTAIPLPAGATFSQAHVRQ